MTTAETQEVIQKLKGCKYCGKITGGESCPNAESAMTCGHRDPSQKVANEAPPKTRNARPSENDPAVQAKIKEAIAARNKPREDVIELKAMLDEVLKALRTGQPLPAQDNEDKIHGLKADTIIADDIDIDDLMEVPHENRFVEEVRPALHDKIAQVSDPVHRPNHYARFKIEPVYFCMVNDLPFWAANVIKYTCRWDAKDGIQDLKKAIRYLEMKVKQLEGDPRFAE